MILIRFQFTIVVMKNPSLFITVVLNWLPIQLSPHWLVLARECYIMYDTKCQQDEPFCPARAPLERMKKPPREAWYCMCVLSPANMGKGKHWDKLENEDLARAGVCASNDPITGNDQTRKRFVKTLFRHFPITRPTPYLQVVLAKVRLTAAVSISAI